MVVLKVLVPALFNGRRLDIVSGRIRMVHAFPSGLAGLNEPNEWPEPQPTRWDHPRSAEACEPELQSLYGTVLQVHAVIAACEGDRSTAREAALRRRRRSRSGPMIATTSAPSLARPTSSCTRSPSRWIWVMR